jgi:hypothetical protein
MSEASNNSYVRISGAVIRSQKGDSKKFQRCYTQHRIDDSARFNDFKEDRLSKNPNHRKRFHPTAIMEHTQVLNLR